jgi:DNA invertase Pin-like site-specific DNA recombinase
MTRVGSARVSSVGQSLEVQLAKLAGCPKNFQEQHRGSSDQRPRLRACLESVREGDTWVVTRLDRLARSTWHLCQIAAELDRKQVHLQVLDQQIDTGDATGRCCSTCSGPSRNSRPNCEPSGRGTESRTPERGGGFAVGPSD